MYGAASLVFIMTCWIVGRFVVLFCCPQKLYIYIYIYILYFFIHFGCTNLFLPKVLKVADGSPAFSSCLFDLLDTRIFEPTGPYHGDPLIMPMVELMLRNAAYSLGHADSDAVGRQLEAGRAWSSTNINSDELHVAKWCLWGRFNLNYNWRTIPCPTLMLQHALGI